MAASIASAINGDASALVTATSSGSTVTLVAKTTGTATDYPVSVTVTDTNSTWTSSGYSPSFGITPLSMQLAGGANGTSNTVYDSGTISVTVDGSTKTVSYGQSSTSATLASALAAAINGDSSDPVTATSNGGTISLTAKDGGSIGNWPLSVSYTYDSSHFSSASFPATASGSSLTGGKDETGSETAIYSFSLTHAPDGQITSASDSVNGNWSYTYDDFNRLKTATETNSGGATISALSWSYDRYGNRWSQTVTAGSGTSTALTFNTANNHASTELSYDAAGNVLNDTNHAYVYDAENRISQVDGGVSYIYDAEGRRVGKSNGTVYVVGLSSNVIDEIDSGAWARSEVYAGSRHLATVTPSGVYFTHTDWLGTERARTSPTGVMCESTVSQPFGDGAQSVTPADTPGCDPTPTFFTGKQRDTESNLDDFGARYFSSQWGRWMSPDWSAAPAAVPYATLENPQSLNLYAYVGNDPVDGQDPTGHSMMSFGRLLDSAFGLEAADQSEMTKEDQTPASKLPQYDPKCNCFHMNSRPGLMQSKSAGGNETVQMRMEL